MGVLGEIAEAMRIGHSGACLQTADHNWAACPYTPTSYAAADVLDALTRGEDDPACIARLIHDRMCRDSDCGPEEAGKHTELDVYAGAARALAHH